MNRRQADAHAKINLALAVTDTRADGYHELRSVFLRLALHDRLEVELVPGGGTIVLGFMGLVWFGRRIAWAARDWKPRDPFPFYLAAGATFIVPFQACINIAVVTDRAPTKGVSPSVHQRWRQQPARRVRVHRTDRERRAPRVRRSDRCAAAPSRSAASSPSGAPRVSTPTTLLAGGGTVGHLGPGFAIADALGVRGAPSVFATPGMAQEPLWFQGRDVPRTIPADRLPRRSWHLPRYAWRLRKHVRAATACLRAHEVDGVIALGGWPCVPAIFAARKVGVPLALVAVDDVPGRVVTTFRRRAARVYVAHAAAGERLGDVVRTVGPILRREVTQGSADPAHFGLDPARRTLLVSGGSLGARAINMWVTDAIRALVIRRPEVRDQLQIVHGTGDAKEAARAEAIYDDAKLVHHVRPYIHAMGAAYATADLFVGRAGAGTVAELKAWGLPAVLVPYPHHADRQQYKNAALLASTGQGVILDQSQLDPQAFDAMVLARWQAGGRFPRDERAAGAAEAIADDWLTLLRANA